MALRTVTCDYPDPDLNGGLVVVLGQFLPDLRHGPAGVVLVLGLEY